MGHPQPGKHDSQGSRPRGKPCVCKAVTLPWRRPLSVLHTANNFKNQAMNIMVVNLGRQAIWSIWIVEGRCDKRYNSR